MSLEQLFYPRAVAVVGSAAEGKLGYEIIRQLLKGGFPAVYAVNPKAMGALGVPGYSAVSQIPAAVDLAVIVSPASTVAGVLEESGRAGVGAAVVITAGFSEVGRLAEEHELKQVAGRWGIRFVGPNCAGILNTGHSLYPTLETLPPAGHTALISQSGALGGVVLGWAAAQGLGISKFVSYGNAADIDEVELLRYLRQDAETRVVALYLESVGAGRAFMQALAECSQDKPVVVIKSGRSQAGQRATLSHTGSLAGSDAVYDAVFRECGAVRVSTIEEMFDFCRGYETLPPVAGKRIAIITNSGGPAVLAADRAEAVGLTVSEPSAALRAELASYLPAQCALRNPVDLTVEGAEEGYRRTLVALLGEYDAALAVNICPPYLDAEPLARGIAAAARETGKPVVANFLPEAVVATSLPILAADGVVNYAAAERAVTAVARLAEYQERRRGLKIRQDERTPERQLPGKDGLLEPEVMAWLRENGVSVPAHEFAADDESAVRAAERIGYPVVLKVVSPDILHKSDRGGVRLNIGDAAGVREAYGAMRQAADGVEFRGVLVYPLIRGGQEVLVGLNRDPQFGPVVAVGMGGSYTELLKDVALRVAPIGAKTANAMLAELRAYPLLRGMRGQPGYDLEALAGLLVRVSELGIEYPEIGELDLNPVFLQRDGLLVGDARVIKRAVES